MTAAISFFRPPIRNTRPEKAIALDEIAGMIRGPELKAVTAELRLCDPQERGGYKANYLPFVTPSGTFTTRAESGLIVHSGLIVLDFDHTAADPRELIRAIVAALPPALCFVSPSGDGLKTIYRVKVSEGPETAKRQHRAYFDALTEFFRDQLNLTADKSGRDIARACFLCADPAAHFDPGAPELDQSFIDTFLPDTKPAAMPEQQPQAEPLPEDQQGEVLQYAHTFCRNQGIEFTEGSRYNYVTTFAAYCNRQGVSLDAVLQELEQMEEPDHTAEEIARNVRGIYRNTKFHGIAPIRPAAAADFTAGIKMFPLSGFPPLLQQIIQEAARIYGTPPDFWAAAIFAAAGAAIGQAVILRTKFENPPLFWLAVIGQSGSGKTEPFKFAFAPLHQADRIKFDEYKRISEFTDPEKGKKGRSQPHFPPQLIVNDATPEALAGAMAARERGIMIEREELAGWIADFNRYNRSGEQQQMLSSWSQSPYKVNRVSGRNLYISQPFVSVAGGIQPEVLPTLAGDGRDVNGFLPRFCFVWPDKVSTPRYCLEDLPPELITAYDNFIQSLLSMPGYRDPVALSREAETIYSDFYNSNAAAMDAAPDDYTRAIYAKLNIHALRAAVLLHVINGGGAELQPDTMQQAIEIAEYFRYTAHKVAAVISKPIDKAPIIKYLGSLGFTSQGEIAKALGVSRQYVNKILNR